MAYFSRENNRSPPRRQGKACGAREVNPDVKVVTRDELIANNIEAMQPKDAAPANGGVMRFIRDTEHKYHPSKAPGSGRRDNDIFGPPVLAPQPKPRIRTGVTDEELQRIWKEDDAKVRASEAMQRGTNLVEKMAKEPINPVVHSARPKDAVPPPRKHIELLTETMVGRNKDHNEPAGFSGMGGHSRVDHRQGRSCKPVDDFTPPELMNKPRVQGRRTRFPPDTLSFQDEYQKL